MVILIPKLFFCLSLCQPCAFSDLVFVSAINRFAFCVTLMSWVDRGGYFFQDAENCFVSQAVFSGR